MEYFVPQQSIVRTIWGKSDTILFVFAGASAEFALNKAVDWLYFTGKLPADPLGRLFSTVRYARDIVFAPKEDAVRTIDKISAIHGGVEKKRGDKIPNWAYRDVLFMLIHYSIAAYELLYRSLTADQKEDVYNVFYRMGCRMNIPELPATYIEWLPVREQHLTNDLVRSHYTDDLFRQYKKHLGGFRFKLLKESQVLVVPQQVIKLLNFRRFSLLTATVPIYKASRLTRLDWLIKEVLLPSAYKSEIKNLDVAPN